MVAWIAQIKGWYLVVLSKIVLHFQQISIQNVRKVLRYLDNVSNKM